MANKTTRPFPSATVSDAAPTQPTVAIHTHGCKLNQADSQALARQFRDAGYRLVEPSSNADVIVLNSCTVTATADAKARQFLRAAKRRKPGRPGGRNGLLRGARPGRPGKAGGCLPGTGQRREARTGGVCPERSEEGPLSVRSSPRCSPKSSLRALVPGTPLRRAIPPWERLQPGRGALEPWSRFRRDATRCAPTASCPGSGDGSGAFLQKE